MRRTTTLVAVAQELLANPKGPHYGYELSKAVGKRSGVVYPLLTRLFDAGWLTDNWEDPVTVTEKRPPRRYYVLTPLGIHALTAIVAEPPHSESDT